MGSRARAGRVTAVVCAAFDPATDRAIYAVRDLVRAAGIVLPDVPPHRPHLSLAAAHVDRETGLPELLALAAETAGGHEPFEVLLDQVGRFGRAGVVWLGPSHAAQLRVLQRDVADALAAAGHPPAFGERSDPARWVPHCTLATRVPKPLLRAVQADVGRQFHPIRARVDALATILVGGRGDVGHARLGSTGP